MGKGLRSSISTTPSAVVWSPQFMRFCNLVKSEDFKAFDIWCEQNNRKPFSVLKKYMRYTALFNQDLIEIALEKEVKDDW